MTPKPIWILHSLCQIYRYGPAAADTGEGCGCCVTRARSRWGGAPGERRPPRDAPPVPFPKLRLRSLRASCETKHALFGGARLGVLSRGRQAADPACPSCGIGHRRHPSTSRVPAVDGRAGGSDRDPAVTASLRRTPGCREACGASGRVDAICQACRPSEPDRPRGYPSCAVLPSSEDSRTDFLGGCFALGATKRPLGLQNGSRGKDDSLPCRCLRAHGFCLRLCTH